MKNRKIKTWGQTITGLWLLKNAVKFHDPVNCRPEKIPVTKEMRKSVRFAHSAYRARLDKEKEEKKKLEETKKKKEEDERQEREGEVVVIQGFFGKDWGGY